METTTQPTTPRYPIGIQTFTEIHEGNYLYVDKTDIIYEIYNPHSLLSALANCKLGQYWIGFKSPAMRNTLLNGYNCNPLRRASRGIWSPWFFDYNIDPASLLFQGGYLTIKDGDPMDDIYKLDVPNKEVRQLFP